MSTPSHLRGRLTRLLDNFAWHATQKANKGGRDPATWNEIERNYEEARKAVMDLFDKLIDPIKE